MPAGVLQLGDLAWTDADNGNGPVERDHSNGGAAAGDGRPLTVNGVVYPKGLGVRADSDLYYHLGGTCRNLTVDVGVDDEVASGSVVFRIYRDDTLVADSGVRTAAQPALRLSADLTGGEELRIVTTSATGEDRNDHGDWGDPRLACGPTDGPAPVSRALGDLPWTSANNGWGPVERDSSNGAKAAGDGHPLAIGGNPYSKGLGVNAPSTITYYLGGTCTGFASYVGIDDEEVKGSVVFQVYADGRKVADSGLLTGTDGPVRLTAPLAGAQELLLQVTDGGDGNLYDHADWAEPRLTCS
jgi:alpha-galactosidase